jgi:hypothetical protein
VGDVFMMVTPGKLWIHLCNPEALANVLRKEEKLPRAMEIFEMTKVFGDNLTTVYYASRLSDGDGLMSSLGGRKSLAQA